MPTLTVKVGEDTVGLPVHFFGVKDFSRRILLSILDMEHRPLSGIDTSANLLGIAKREIAKGEAEAALEASDLFHLLPDFLASQEIQNREDLYNLLRASTIYFSFQDPRISLRPVDA